MRLSTPRNTATPTTSTVTWSFPRTSSRRSRPRANFSPNTSGVPSASSSHAAGTTTKYTGLSPTSSSSADPSAPTPPPDCLPMDSILPPTTSDQTLISISHSFAITGAPSLFLSCQKRACFMALVEGAVMWGRMLLCVMSPKKEKER